MNREVENSPIAPKIAVVVVILALAGTLGWIRASAASHSSALPDPVVDTPLAAGNGEQTAVISGGCFWGIQAVFQHVKGVKNATSGYSGGAASTAEYELVSTGSTGHAESVKIAFDPSQVFLWTTSQGVFLRGARPHGTQSAGA